jgi:hypothetical protein
MKLVERTARWTTGVGIRILCSVIPRLSDRTLAHVLHTAERLVFLFTGNEDLKASIAEVAEVFESGPPYTAVLRKVLASMETDLGLAVSTLACLKKPSPYGAE